MTVMLRPSRSEGKTRVRHVLCVLSFVAFELSWIEKEMQTSVFYIGGESATGRTPGFCRREYLQSPYDLVKVAAFRRKLEKEKASIDARLKSDQLDATREGLKKLLSMRNHVQVLKEEMQTIDRLYRPAERRIDI
ncbi:hypothetical protein L210DRAFT_3757126 [Boletus edulis BED1]|uniref:Uncharacterized protein n=1 Tax=Boletus edulis BED1 TaxID=1328754 RepID=A0AAD4C5U2_BOLED|nr:hypothetical protein L210DRAFT_3757126 [Boletus edulis BED1]